MHHAPGPQGFDYERDGFNIADDDNGIYFRPETGNHILVGSTDPRCDPQDWVDPDHYHQLLVVASKIPSPRIIRAASAAASRGSRM